MVANGFFWFGLVGWVAGWVTGKAMKCQSHSPWVDALVGLAGGLVTGYFARSLEATGNWGFLMAVMVAAAGGAIVTWGAHRIKERLHHIAH